MSSQRDSLYLLSPGDRVLIPVRQLKQVSVQSGIRISLRRRGVPEKFSIRFQNPDDSSRVGVPYLLSVRTIKNDFLADIRGETDSGGFVNAAIAPSAKFAELILGIGAASETYYFRLGHIDPIDTVSGWQARLNNLGFDCGAEDGELGELTQGAISAFQSAKQLPETGEMDAVTQEALKAATLC